MAMSPTKPKNHFLNGHLRGRRRLPMLAEAGSRAGRETRDEHRREQPWGGVSPTRHDLTNILTGSRPEVIKPSKRSCEEA
jgi:hypothetical protein